MNRRSFIVLGSLLAACSVSAQQPNTLLGDGGNEPPRMVAITPSDLPPSATTGAVCLSRDAPLRFVPCDQAPSTHGKFIGVVILTVSHHRTGKCTDDFKAWRACDTSYSEPVPVYVGEFDSQKKCWDAVTAISNRKRPAYVTRPDTDVCIPKQPFGWPKP